MRPIYRDSPEPLASKAAMDKWDVIGWILLLVAACVVAKFASA